MSQSSPDFSFDLYPGLDRELDDIYRRNVEQGVAPDDVLVANGLANTVNQKLGQVKLETFLSPEVLAWASAEIPAALTAWQAYGTELSQSIPHDINELLEQPSKKERLKYLFGVKEALTASGETTPEGVNIGETMHLVLIPWKTIQDNIDHFPGWVQTMRDKQGVATNTEYFAPQLWTAIENGTKLYRDPNADVLITPIPGWIDAKQYISQRMIMDGDLGMMLVQTSDDAGINRLVQGSPADRTPNALTNNGDDNFTIAGNNVGQMGIFEWASLTLQHDPRTLSSQDVSWMLANRLDVNGGPYVPYGYWGDVRVKSDLDRADYDSGDVRPRLAVMQNT